MQLHDYLTPKQAGDRLGIAPRTLANWRALGKGPAYVKTPSSSIRYRLADLVEWIESGTVVPA